MKSVAISDAVSRLRTVERTNSAVQAARALGISFGDCPTGENPFCMSTTSAEVQECEGALSV
jgi:ATP-dependent phosphofructokinase / diphosphate-dependent phosphofructokinase